MKRVLAVLAVLACAEPAPPVPSCDAGDVAFVHRVVPLLWGRRPHGSAEVLLLARLAEERGRAGLVRAMAQTHEYVEHWRLVLLDNLRASRLNERANAPCYGRGLHENPGPEFAGWMREHNARDAAPAPFTMHDLMRSALKLDDLSPIYRANLFAELWAEYRVPDLPGARAHTDSRIETFMQAYLSRKLECLVCHNSEFSVTGAEDPALDRTWEIPGHYERALFGVSTGVPVAALRTFFRRWGVVAGAFYDTDYREEAARDELAAGVRPFGLDASCGVFSAGGLERPHDDWKDAYFGAAAGPEANIWTLEEQLRRGFETLRRDGVVLGSANEVDPDVAFAWLVSTTVAENVWLEAFGEPLTLPHAFPRNSAQRDALWALAKRFAGSGFSLVELLVAVTELPVFNPGSTCGELPPWFQPFGAEDQPLPAVTNTVGDAVNRLPSRVALRAVSAALEWTPPSDYLLHFAMPEAVRQRNLGVFLKHADPGYRGTNFQTLLAWEGAYAACRDPLASEECGLIPFFDFAGEETACWMCSAAPEEVCAWDERCCDLAWFERCTATCPTGDIDFDIGNYPKAVRPPSELDWLDRLLAAAPPGSTREALVRALKDRLLGTAALDPREHDLLGSLFDSGGLDTAYTAADADGLRRVCGVLLLSADFQLQGVGKSEAVEPPPFALEGQSEEALCRTLGRQLFPDLSCL